jgi:hypothetical protein
METCTFAQAVVYPAATGLNSNPPAPNPAKRPGSWPRNSPPRRWQIVRPKLDKRYVRRTSAVNCVEERCFWERPVSAIRFPGLVTVSVTEANLSQSGSCSCSQFLVE